MGALTFCKELAHQSCNGAHGHSNISMLKNHTNDAVGLYDFSNLVLG